MVNPNDRIAFVGGHRLAPAVLLAALVSVLLWWPPVAQGETGGVLTLPGRAPTNGLTMTLDSRWVVGSGYHPIRVTIALSPRAPSPRQRTFRVELRMIGTVQREPHLVSQFLNIEQGDGAGEATILVPQTDAWTMTDVTVYEDGRSLGEISGRVSLQQASTDDVSEARPAALFIDDDTPVLDDRAQLIAELQIGQRRNERKIPWVSALSSLRYRRNTSMNFRQNRALDSQVLMQLQNDKRGALMPAKSLPNQWLAYTSVDLIVCTLDQWQTLRREEAARYETLRRWIRAGGNLVLVDPDMKSRVGEVGPAIEAYFPETSLPVGRGGLVINGSSWSQSMGSIEDRNRPDRKLEPGEVSRIWSVQLGMGQAVAVDGNLYDFQPQSFRQILNSMSSHRWTWFQRNGISKLRHGSDYNFYEIPGVGDPPLLTFLGSITLFVIAIGPVNYLLLRRWKRLYLLLVTVPVGAAIVTATIFITALVADGLGTRVMVRSCTVLDQPRGEATTWSRQTYYAGVKPSQGLNFSDDTAAYPILNPTVNLFRETRRNPRTLHWEDGKQMMTNGYLSSRRMEQFLVIEPEQTTAAVDVTASESGLTITNRLGANIRLLVLRDETGTLYSVRGVAESAEATLETTDAPNAMAALRGLISDANPRTQRTNRYVRYDYQFERFQYQQLDMDAGVVDFAPSRMEKLIQGALGLPTAGSYFAVLDQSPWAEIGTKATLVDGGLHLVRARWK